MNTLEENLLVDTTNCYKYYYWTAEEVSSTAKVHGTLSNKLGKILMNSNNKMFNFTYPLNDSSTDYYRSILTVNLAEKEKSGRLHVIVETKSPNIKEFTVTLDLDENFIDNIGLDKVFKQIIKHRGKTKYGFILGSTLARHTEKGYKDALLDLSQQIISKFNELEKSIKQEYDNIEKKLLEVEKARAITKNS